MKYFLICSGLERINRGYETFAREFFTELNKINIISNNWLLFKGGGEKRHNEIPIFNFHRNGRISFLISKVTGTNRYIIEQQSFFLFSIWYLLRHRPILLFLSDYRLACYYAHFKRFTGFKYQILFSNGAPNGPPFQLFDRVHQLLPVHRNLAVAAGEAPEKHILLPYPVMVPNKQEVQKWAKDRKQKDEHHVICIGAINNNHKRVDFLIDVVLRLNMPNVCLTLIGQQDSSSAKIIIRGKNLLGKKFKAFTVAPELVSNYLATGNILVLPSLSEGLPRAVLEALGHGLPVLLHDYPVTREAFGNVAFYTNMEDKVKCSNDLRNLLLQESIQMPEAIESRRNFIEKNYSWPNLFSGYLEMVKTTINETCN
jgi:glycosyltransferase involved in cell wall biosynthesis